MQAEAAHPRQARAVDAGRGIAWWTEAWAIFMGQAGLWIVLGLLLLVVLIGLSVVPLLGSIAGSVLMPVFVGSWMLAARKVAQGGTLEVADLFLGFKDRLNPLLVLGAAFLVAGIAIAIVVGVLGLGAAVGVAGTGASAGGILAAIGASLLAVLSALVLGVLASMALWYAPALVVLHGMAPVEAMHTSFAACLRNGLAHLLYAVVCLVAMALASIPFGLGWLVLVPVMLLSVYVSCEDLFG